MSIPLQSAFVYGPIHSRRLGNSLGINILPNDAKFCLSNCLYCQYGATNLRAVRMIKLPPAQKIIEALNQDFEQYALSKTKIDAITFSGNGEPTLHPELEKIFRSVQTLRDCYYPKAKIGILSDSSRVHLAPVRKVLSEFDERYMKLDAGDPKTYETINQPMGGVKWDEMMEGLKALKKITIQSLFISAPVNNSEGVIFDAWLGQVKDLAPSAVHIYTLDRSPADSRVKPVSTRRLQGIAERVMKDLPETHVSCFENKHEHSVGMNP